MTQRKANESGFQNVASLSESFIDWTMIRDGINTAYQLLDIIDSQLVVTESPKLAELVELANLSSILGNLLGSGIATSTKGVYKRNRPHAYPDLIPEKPNVPGLEIKVALETNRPKGHLPKSGYYLTFRYVLGDEHGNHKIGERQNTIWIWEARHGYIAESDFSISNTAGDSGKTAVIKAEAFNRMGVVFFDSVYSPYKKHR